MKNIILVIAALALSQIAQAGGGGGDKPGMGLMSIHGSQQVGFDLPQSEVIEAGQVVSMDEGNQEVSSTWICYAQGKQSFGGPVGDIWQTVTGIGTTQFEALANAISICSGQGLESCTLGGCVQQ